MIIGITAINQNVAFFKVRGYITDKLVYNFSCFYHQHDPTGPLKYGYQFFN